MLAGTLAQIIVLALSPGDRDDVAARQWLGAELSRADSAAIAATLTLSTSTGPGMLDAAGLSEDSVIRYQDGNHWRWNTERRGVGGDAAYVDWARDGDRAWKLTPHWLVMLDPKRRSPPDHPVNQIEEHVREVHSLFWSNGFDSIRHGQVLKWQFLPPDRWTASIHVGEETITVEGTWISATARGRITRLKDTRGEIHFGEWLFPTKVSERQFPGVLLFFDHDQNLLKRVRMLDIDLKAIEESMFTVPEWPGSDAIRGTLTAWSSTDYRESPPIHRWVKDGRIVTQSETDVSDLVATNVFHFRILGWLCGVASLLLAVALRLRQSFTPIRSLS